jgi:threonine/homoserine/homoserine lactone efflux protein
MDLTPYLPQLLLAWSIQLMGVLSPGPGVMLILGVATTRGRAAALVATFGIACGAVVLAIATVVGIAALFAEVAALMLAVKLIGAAYLAWLAWGCFKRALDPPPLATVSATPGSAAKTALGGFLMQISNPKAIFFWLAVAAVGGVGDAPLSVIAIFVAGAFVNSYVGHGVWALILSSTPVRSLYARARRWIEGALGILFTAFAIRLATDRS